MYCCNLALRSPTIPLFSTLSIHQVTLQSTTTLLKCNRFFLVPTRVLSSSSTHKLLLENRNSSRRRSSQAAVVDKSSNPETKRSSRSSSWGESAENYFSRNATNKTVETQEQGNVTHRRDRGSKGTGVEKRSAGRTNRPSWERSMQPYRVPTRGNREGSVDNREYRGEDKVIDYPRRTRIDNKNRGFNDREAWNDRENWGRPTWKEDKESSLLKMDGQCVYGVGPVLAALTVERREFYTLYVQKGLDCKKKKDKTGVETVMRLAEKIGVKVVEASKHDLNMVSDNRPHQGLVLDASPLEMVNIRELEGSLMEGQQAPLWVALDEVTDPQNLGAIVRSAYYFGVQGVVLCAKNSAPLSGVVSKASAGSLELIELRSCKNMMQFLCSSIENGWRVLGGSVSSKARPLSKVEPGVPTILVLGSEGSGLRPLVERSCTSLIRIPGNLPTDECTEGPEHEVEEVVQNRMGQELKSFLAVESLNVSVAAGVLLYHLVGNSSHSIHEKPSTSSD